MPPGQVRALVRQHGRELPGLEDGERTGGDHDGRRPAGHAVHRGPGGVQYERRVPAVGPVLTDIVTADPVLADTVADDAGGLSVLPGADAGPVQAAAVTPAEHDQGDAAGESHGREAKLVG